ncbi:uncharacterized protein BDV17DRAFT_254917 [Aspergillus undulatus]|uniref:uncharacterized protein n=1 Tax=Aspergillus undulatus TaxID=1810928 RepID=UPI003CCD424E
MIESSTYKPKDPPAYHILCLKLVASFILFGRHNTANVPLHTSSSTSMPGPYHCPRSLFGKCLSTTTFACRRAITDTGPHFVEDSGGCFGDLKIFDSLWL